MRTRTNRFGTLIDRILKVWYPVNPLSDHGSTPVFSPLSPSPNSLESFIKCDTVLFDTEEYSLIDLWTTTDCTPLSLGQADSRSGRHMDWELVDGRRSSSIISWWTGGDTEVLSGSKIYRWVPGMLQPQSSHAGPQCDKRKLRVETVTLECVCIL